MKRGIFLMLALSLTIMLSTLSTVAANASQAWSVRTLGVSQESDTSTSEENPEYSYSVWYDAVIHHTEDGGFEIVVAYPHYFEIEITEEVWDPTDPTSDIYFEFEEADEEFSIDEYDF